MRIGDIRTEVAANIVHAVAVVTCDGFGRFLFTESEVIGYVLNTRVERRHQANVQGVCEIGTDDVRTTSD